MRDGLNCEEIKFQPNLDYIFYAKSCQEAKSKAVGRNPG
jgi:hypothetical protein